MNTNQKVVLVSAIVAKATDLVAKLNSFANHPSVNQARSEHVVGMANRIQAKIVDRPVAEVPSVIAIQLVIDDIATTTPFTHDANSLNTLITNVAKRQGVRL